MSTHSRLDKICAAIVVCCLILTALFINGESLGITKIVDEDAEQNSNTQYFTAKDQDGDWDTSDATVITLTGDGASISGRGAYTNDGNVVIKNAGYYVVSGELTDGFISVDAYDSSKVFILLDGAEINCSDDACIRVEQADKVFLTLAKDSQNTLTSGSDYSEEALKDGTDGTIFAHDDLTINGSGSLTVNAQYRHGIAANDDLVITGGTISVTAPVDAIHAKDSLRIKEASITVDAGDDGIVTSNEEEKGYLYIESGSLTVTAADDGIHSTGEIIIAGGDLNISAGDDGIHSDTSIAVSDGRILINECYEGIEALVIDVSGGDITIYPTDDGFNANGNKDSQIGAGGMGGMGGGRMGDASGGTNAGQKDGFPGARKGWDTEASQEATSGESMESPADIAGMDATAEMPAPPDMAGMDATAAMEQRREMDPAEGNASAQSTQAANKEETYINISGGTITIINEKGNDADGLDSNGDLFISGGMIYVSLLGSGSNSAIDYGSENGGVAEISGGTIIACGASSMAEAFDSSSTQASILYNTSTVSEAGTTLAIEDTDGNVLLSWEVPCSFSSALVSCPQMETGGTYIVAIGDNTEEITLEEVSGSYGDAQSSMFGGAMHWGGMQPRGGLNGENAATDSTDTAAAPFMGGKRGGHRGMQFSPDQSGMSGEDISGSPADHMPSEDSGMSGEGTSGTAADHMPLEDSGMSGEGTSGSPADHMPSDMVPGERSTDSMEMQRDQSPEEKMTEEMEETESAASFPDAETWGILGGCTVFLLAGIAVAKLYKKRGSL